jgi:hypothetical protein
MRIVVNLRHWIDERVVEDNLQLLEVDLDYDPVTSLMLWTKNSRFRFGMSSLFPGSLMYSCHSFSGRPWKLELLFFLEPLAVLSLPLDYFACLVPLLQV